MPEQSRFGGSRRSLQVSLESLQRNSAYKLERMCCFNLFRFRRFRVYGLKFNRVMHGTGLVQGRRREGRARASGT